MIANIIFVSWGYQMAELLFKKVKYTCTVLIYRKLCSVRLSSLNKINTGKIVNVVANELNRFAQIVYAPYLVISPIVMVVTFVVLWINYGALAFIFLVLYILVNMFQRGVLA